MCSSDLKAKPHCKHRTPLQLQAKIIIKNLAALGWSSAKIHRVADFANARTIRRYMKTPKACLEIKETRGRKRMKSDKEDLQILKVCEETPGTLKAKCDAVKKQLHITMSTKTIGRRMKQSGVKFKRLKPVPMLTQEHIAKRIQFCNTYKRINWDRVVFFDETSIQLYRSKSRG